RQFRLAGIHAEEIRIELIDVVEDRACLHEVGLTTHLVGEAVIEIRLGETGNGLHAVAEIPPELRDVASTGKTSRHTNNRDPVVLSGACAILRAACAGAG